MRAKKQLLTQVRVCWEDKKKLLSLQTINFKKEIIYGYSKS